MQGQNQQQAYDRGITIFSPDGRLYQVEYAREAVKRGTASIGVRTADGVVFVVDKRIHSPLVESASIEKLHKVDDHVGVASAGHVSDGRQLIDYARRMAQVDELRYGQPIGVEALTKMVTDNIQQYTQVGGARPFGVALIIGGIENGQPRLFETDPSGTPREWKALAVGQNRSEIEEYLEEHYRADADLEAGIELGLRALASVQEEGIEPEGIGLATVDVETEAYRERTTEEKADYLDEYDLLAEEGSEPGSNPDSGGVDEDEGTPDSE